MYHVENNNKGTIVSVRGSVIDAHFLQRLPSLFSEIRAGEKGEIVIEVLITYILVPLVIGIALGILNYAALRLTVKNMHLVKYPGLLTVVSFLLRMGVILVIFYLVMGGSWERLIVCLLGFIVVRSYFVRRFQSEQKIYNPLKKEEQRHDNQL